jgi:hypothetical protein
VEKYISETGLYPIVIRQSRYSGIYEGGLWFAMPSHEEVDLTEAYIEYIHGDDCDAVDFWDSDIAKTFGVGNTPDEAITDLLAKNYEVKIEEIQDSAYLDIRNKFQSTIDGRKEPFARSPQITSDIHLERTAYFENSSGYKNNDKL